MRAYRRATRGLPSVTISNMAGSAKNFSLYTYTDNSGQAWNLRGEKDTVRNAVDGNTAAGAHPAYGRTTSRKSPRKIVYVDLTTFRTKSVIFYTAAAFAAITLGSSTLSWPIEGEVAAVVYTASKAIPERTPKATAGPNLGQHA
jgi:hypothetical protein